MISFLNLLLYFTDQQLILSLKICEYESFSRKFSDGYAIKQSKAVPVQVMKALKRKRNPSTHRIGRRMDPPQVSLDVSVKRKFWPSPMNRTPVFQPTDSRFTG